MRYALMNIDDLISYFIKYCTAKKTNVTPTAHKGPEVRFCDFEL